MSYTLLIVISILAIPDKNISQSKSSTSPLEVKSRLMSDTIRMLQSDVLYQQHEVIIKLK